MGLPRRWRLGDTNRIREVLGRGRRAGGAIGSVHVLPADGPHCRACLVFSRRVGSAVERNRGRRRVQAVLAALESRFAAPVDVVFRAKRTCVELDFGALGESLERLLIEARALERAR